MNAPMLPPYQPATGRSRWVVRLLVLALVIDVIGIISGVMELRLLDRGADITESAADANDLRQQLVGIAQIAVFVACAIAFILWLRRITANLPALGAQGMRFGTGWATGGWFVPILQLWRPKEVVNDAWRASDPEKSADMGGTWRDSSVPGFLALWWAAWIINNIMGQASFRMSAAAESLDSIITASRVTLGADVTSIIADVAAIVVVTRLTQRQVARAERVAGTIDAPGGDGGVSPVVATPAT